MQDRMVDAAPNMVDEVVFLVLLTAAAHIVLITMPTLTRPTSLIFLSTSLSDSGIPSPSTDPRRMQRESELECCTNNLIASSMIPTLCFDTSMSTISLSDRCELDGFPLSKGCPVRTKTANACGMQKSSQISQKSTPHGPNI